MYLCIYSHPSPSLHCDTILSHFHWIRSTRRFNLLILSFNWSWSFNIWPCLCILPHPCLCSDLGWRDLGSFNSLLAFLMLEQEGFTKGKRQNLFLELGMQVHQYFEMAASKNSLEYMCKCFGSFPVAQCPSIWDPTSVPYTLSIQRFPGVMGRNQHVNLS